MVYEESGEMNWTVHPARKYPRKAVATVMLIIIFCVIVLWSFHSVFWVVVSAVVLTASLARFFFPTKYRMTDEFVEVNFLGFRQKRSWKNLRRVDKTKNGVFLSPFLKYNRLENYRGLLVICDGNQSEVFDFARKHSEKEREKKEKSS